MSVPPTQPRLYQGEHCRFDQHRLDDDQHHLVDDDQHVDNIVVADYQHVADAADADENAD